MKRFAALYRGLEETTKTSRKLERLREYFRVAAPADAAWGVYFLSGRKPKRLLGVRELATWATEAADIPGWLFDECADVTGDLAETIALLLPETRQSTDLPLTTWVEDRLLALRSMAPEEQRATLTRSWDEMDRPQRLVWNKLITGSFRVGVSQTLLVRALAEVAGIPAAVIAHRLMGTWEPSAAFYLELMQPEAAETDVSRPYPFCLAHPLDGAPNALGDVQDWMAEWKWDGIRAQCIRRQAQTFLWSRGEELLTERFPELLPDAARLPEGTVLDGEIVGWKDGAVMPFAALQRRIGRKSLGKKILADVPVRFIAFDLLEEAGTDIRTHPLRDRRARLETLLDVPPAPTLIRPSPVLEAASWDKLSAQRDASRSHNVEGLMLKSLDSVYGVGRVTGQWWKWKIAPHTIDAVLVYAQRGSGRRASLYTDYTFAIWHNDELVPFAKAYSGLTDEEIRQVDRFVRENTLEKFGPVRRVKPELVFELAFENVQLSNRHKSGVAVRFPRMSRWRTDKLPKEADSLESVKALLATDAGSGER